MYKNNVFFSLAIHKLFLFPNKQKNLTSNTSRHTLTHTHDFSIMGNRGSTASGTKTKRPNHSSLSSSSSSSSSLKKEASLLLSTSEPENKAVAATFDALRRKAAELWFRYDEEDKDEKNHRRASALLIDALYENRWFIKHSDAQKREDLDALISSQFGQLLDELRIFYREKKKKKESDRTNNNDQHHEFIRECLHDIEKNEDKESATNNTVVPTIVVLDQFSRHHFRGCSSLREGSAAEAEANIALLDEVCVTIVDRCLEKIDVTSHLIDAKQLVFLLMPYRHTQKTLPRLKKIIDCLDERIESDSASLELLKKFKKTSLRCYQDLEGKQWHPETNSEILEFFEFDPTAEQIEKAMRMPIVDAVRKFMESKRDRFDYVEGDDKKPIAVSLSGGVDSMVLGMILKQLGYTVIALHINYGNRPEANAEASFLDVWCRKHAIACEIKNMNSEGLKRGVTPRETYEIEARKIRFDFYKLMRQKYKYPAVLLGHHDGDVQENVITNMFRGANVLNVNGMSDEGIIENVRIWRPMLSRPKSDVLDFAHTFGVPYFLDSTPTWSTRGKLRNQLVPLLADMFGEGFLRNVTQIGRNSEMLDEMVKNSIFNPFYAKVRVSDAGIYVPCEAFTAQPLFFWKETLREFCHKLGTNGFKDESVGQIVKKITADTSSATPTKTKPPKQRGSDPDNVISWLPVKRETKVFLTADASKTLAMFAEEFFSEATVATFENFSVPVKSFSDDDQNGKIQTRICGPWSITLEMVPSTNREELERPKCFSIWDALDNNISYHIPVRCYDANDEYDVSTTEKTFHIDTDWRIPPTCNLDNIVRKHLPIVVPLGHPPYRGKSEKEKNKKHRTWAPRFVVGEDTSDAANNIDNGIVKVTLRFRRHKPFSEEDEAAP